MPRIMLGIVMLFKRSVSAVTKAKSTKNKFISGMEGRDKLSDISFDFMSVKVLAIHTPEAYP